MGRWLAVREEWQDVKYGGSAKSGGYVVGHLITRTALVWIDAPSKRDALALAPFGATTVLSWLSLDVSDRDGWLKMTLGEPQLLRVTLFDDGKSAECVAQAMPKRSAQCELVAA